MKAKFKKGVHDYDTSPTRTAGSMAHFPEEEAKKFLVALKEKHAHDHIMHQRAPNRTARKAKEIVVSQDSEVPAARAAMRNSISIRQMAKVILLRHGTIQNNLSTVNTFSEIARITGIKASTCRAIAHRWRANNFKIISRHGFKGRKKSISED